MNGLRVPIPTNRRKTALHAGSRRLTSTACRATRKHRAGPLQYPDRGPCRLHQPLQSHAVGHRCVTGCRRLRRNQPHLGTLLHESAGREGFRRGRRRLGSLRHRRRGHEPAACGELLQYRADALQPRFHGRVPAQGANRAALRASRALPDAAKRPPTSGLFQLLLE